MGTVLISIIQLAVSVLLATIAAYLGIWLFERATVDIDEWKALREGNTAVGITLAGVVIGLAIILQPAVAGALPSTVGRMAPDVEPGLLPILLLVVMLVRAFLGLVLGAGAILFSIWLFLRLTRDIDELAELRQGNQAVGIMLAGGVIAISLLVSPVVAGITDWLLPLIVS